MLSLSCSVLSSAQANIDLKYDGAIVQTNLPQTLPAPDWNILSALFKDRPSMDILSTLPWQRMDYAAGDELFATGVQPIQILSQVQEQISYIELVISQVCQQPGQFSQELAEREGEHGEPHGAQEGRHQLGKRQ